MSQMESNLRVAVDDHLRYLLYFILLEENEFRWFGPWFDTSTNKSYLESDGNIDKDDFINYRSVSLFEIEYYGLNDVFNKWI